MASLGNISGGMENKVRFIKFRSYSVNNYDEEKIVAIMLVMMVW